MYVTQFLDLFFETDEIITFPRHFLILASQTLAQQRPTDAGIQTDALSIKKRYPDAWPKHFLLVDAFVQVRHDQGLKMFQQIFSIIKPIAEIRFMCPDLNYNESFH